MGKIAQYYLCLMFMLYSVGKERNDCNYSIEGNMTKYYAIRKFHANCNGLFNGAAQGGTNKTRNSQTAVMLNMVLICLLCCHIQLMN